MFSFLNTVEVLPVERVSFIAETLGAAGLDAAILVKARTGVPGHISLNAWVASCEPISHSIPTEVVCSAEREEELKELLEKLVQDIQAVTMRASGARSTTPAPISLSPERAGRSPHEGPASEAS